MHIGEISEESEISTSCIRYYEQHGVIPEKESDSF
jgi:DNA-binding transcriptional MerR regulator